MRFSRRVAKLGNRHTDRSYYYFRFTRARGAQIIVRFSQ